MKYVQVIIILFFSLLSISCKRKNNDVISCDENFFTEVKRISSPDKKVDAVLVETEGGATVANGNLVFIVLPARKISKDDIGYSIINTDHSAGLDIEWKQNQHLFINYFNARIFKFSNFWQSDSVENWNYVVEIQLNCTSSNGQLSQRDMSPMRQ